MQEIRPATNKEKLETYKWLTEARIDLFNNHVEELVEQLYIKWLENPDSQTQKLLIMHLGSEFFNRRG